MKKYIIIIACLTSALISWGNNQDKRGEYRVIPVGNSQWMSSKNSDIEAVHAQIDRIAEDGYNLISIGTYMFMPQYLVDYAASPYPEAVQFSKQKTDDNLASLRENIRYAKSRGITYVVSRSYSHYAPYNFWKAHQKELNPDGLFTELLERAHQNDMYRNTLQGKSPNTIPQQQWTNDTFRNFFLWSTEKVLDLVPELDGFMNAYAEAAWTYDTLKLRRSGWASWKECVDYNTTDSCFIDYCNKLNDMLVRKRGDNYIFGMRDWYVAPNVLAKLSMPKDKLLIAIKYAGYDQPLRNYPPWGKDLLNAGFGVILDMHIYDAEYPHPIYWYSSDVINTTFDNIRNGGFTGIVNQDYTIRGEDSPNNPIRRLTQITASRAINGKPLKREDVIEILRKDYRDGASNLLTSLESVANAQENYIKLMPSWFWRGDGLSVGGLQPPRFWMLFDNPEAVGRMGFVRQNVVGMREYIDAFLLGHAEFNKACAEWESRGMINPEQVLTSMHEDAQKAISSILQARAKAPKNAPYLNDIVASAFIHKELVDRNTAYVRAAIAFYKSGYTFDDKYDTSRTKTRTTPYSLEDECIAHLIKFIDADLMMRRLMLDYAPRRRVMRHANTYVPETKIAKIAGRNLPIIKAEDSTRLAAIIKMIEQK